MRPRLDDDIENWGKGITVNANFCFFTGPAFGFGAGILSTAVSAWRQTPGRSVAVKPAYLTYIGA